MDRRPEQFFRVLTEVSDAIQAGGDLDDVLTFMLRRIAETLGARGCTLRELDAASGALRLRAACGLSRTYLDKGDVWARYSLSEVFEDGPVVIRDVARDPRIQYPEVAAAEGIVAVVGLPLDLVGGVRQVLRIYFDRAADVDDDTIRFLDAVASQGAAAVRCSLLQTRYFDTFRQTVTGLALALEAKDPFTHGHSLKVANYARRTAATLGLAPPRIETIYHAGLLHDIGKIGMQDRMLSRLGRLSAREMDVIRMHPVIGARILSPLTFLQELVPLVRHHHERWDGQGYPDGLAGTAIPLGARILAVCDAFDCMLSGRPYMAPIPLDAALEQLASGAGSRFDPDAAAALAAEVRRNPQLATPLAPVDDYLAQFRIDRPRPRPPVFESGTYPTSF